MNKFLIVCAVGSIIFLGSCNSRIAGIFNRELMVDHFEFNYLQSKAKLSFDDGKQKISATANIRIRKDSIIWISITPGLGVEAARMLITKDSVQIIDKISKKYFQLSFEEISVQYNFQLDYNSIESILLGNLILPYNKEQITTSDEFVSYKQLGDNFQFMNFIGVNTHKLEKLMVKDNKTKAVISVNYGDFDLVGDEVFPFNIKVIVDNPGDQVKNTVIDIEYNKAKVEDKAIKFPFNIPSKYKSY